MKILAALALVALAGCAAQTLNVRPMKSYTVGQPLRASVGGTLLSAQKGELRTTRRWVGILNSPDGWETRTDPMSDFVKQELLYSGKTGNIIEFAYREFRGGYAAPAFYQGVKYDLSESKVVTFQNYKIEVYTATNSEFTGKLLSD